MARIRILRRQKIVAADPGEKIVVDAATARALVESGDAERVIDRSVEIERTEERR